MIFYQGEYIVLKVSNFISSMQFVLTKDGEKKVTCTTVSICIKQIKGKSIVFYE
jgi:hypothetical protein